MLSGVFTATSYGYLTHTPLPGESAASTSSHTVLPTRLRDFKVSPNGAHFAYGGDEVDISLWDTERGLAGPPSPPIPGLKLKKQKVPELLYGEVWRAQNVSGPCWGFRIYLICKRSRTTVSRCGNL